MNEKVIVTGARGFTGKYVIQVLRKYNYIPYNLDANLINYKQVYKELDKIKPNNIIHLAGISYTQHKDISKIYQSNLYGTINLLEAIKNLNLPLNSMLIASTGSCYKNNSNTLMNEDSIIEPKNHYSVSKIAMEFAANLYANIIPLIIVRPFNYTGVGQDPLNLVPKIVEAFKKKDTELSLGNINISREFNDVRSIACLYVELIKNIKTHPTPINICSGKAVSISKIIELCSRITNHKIQIKKDIRFVRKNDPKEIVGDTRILKSLIPNLDFHSIEDTLFWMLSN